MAEVTFAHSLGQLVSRAQRPQPMSSGVFGHAGCFAAAMAGCNQLFLVLPAVPGDRTTPQGRPVYEAGGKGR
jgi:hypothetical protein